MDFVHSPVCMGTYKKYGQQNFIQTEMLRYEHFGTYHVLATNSVGMTACSMCQLKLLMVLGLKSVVIIVLSLPFQLCTDSVVERFRWAVGEF